MSAYHYMYLPIEVTFETEERGVIGTSAVHHGYLRKI
jgi:hypothetical protein